MCCVLRIRVSESFWQSTAAVVHPRYTVTNHTFTLSVSRIFHSHLHCVMQASSLETFSMEMTSPSLLLISLCLSRSTHTHTWIDYLFSRNNLLHSHSTQPNFIWCEQWTTSASLKLISEKRRKMNSKSHEIDDKRTKLSTKRNGLERRENVNKTKERLNDDWNRCVCSWSVYFMGNPRCCLLSAFDLIYFQINSVCEWWRVVE